MKSLVEFLAEATQRMALASANLQSLKYNDVTQTLTVYFRSGGIYAYRDVPPETVEELKHADSRGQFFFLYIRDSFPFTCLRRSRPGFRHAKNTAKGRPHHFGMGTSAEHK